MGYCHFLGEFLTFGDKMKSILTHTKDFSENNVQKLLDFKELFFFKFENHQFRQ
jgi:hypothetical protein